MAKHWIQKAVNKSHVGYCTPMTKKTCTPKRKALARTFKKHHGFHAGGGIVEDFDTLMEYAMGGKVKRKKDLMQYATGGYAQGVPVELEGQEVIETPEGSVGTVQGPSHESGGVPITVPEGTEVYSKRISIDGETMADRKKKRVNYMKRIDKALEANPSDKINKDTAKRAEAATLMEDQQDMKIQLAARPVLNPEQFAGGGIAAGATDTIDLSGIDMQDGLGAMPWATLFKGLMDIGMQVAEGKSPETKSQLVQETSGLRPYAKGGVVYKDPVSLNQLPEAREYDLASVLEGYLQRTSSPYTPEMVEMPSVDPRLPSEVRSSLLRDQLKAHRRQTAATEPEEMTPIGNTIGNVVGAVGTAVGTVGPLINTLNNRRATRPNINAYLNYGKDALETNLQEFDVLDNQRQTAQEALALSTNAARMRNANSATSINTQRALDSITDLGYNNALNQMEVSLGNQRLGSLARREQLQNQADAYRMQGEQMRDMGDRQDLDAFYSNLGQDIAGVGMGIQSFGKNLNTSQETADMQYLISEMSKYGMGVTRDKRGNIKIRKVK